MRLRESRLNTPYVRGVMPSDQGRFRVGVGIAHCHCGASKAESGDTSPNFRFVPVQVQGKNKIDARVRSRILRAYMGHYYLFS